MCNRRKGKTSYVQKKNEGKLGGSLSLLIHISYPTLHFIHSFIVLILGASPEEPDEEDEEGEDILEEEEEEEEEHESESESSGMGPPSSDSSSLSGSRSESIPKASSAGRSQPILSFAN